MASSPFPTAALTRVPEEVGYWILRKASEYITPRARAMVLRNYQGAGIGQGERKPWQPKHTHAIEHMIRSSTCGWTWDHFHLTTPAGFRWPDDPRKDAAYYIVGALDAGAVLSTETIGASAKRSVKRALLAGRAVGEATTRAVRQVHDGRVIGRKALSLKGVRVIPGHHFWKFRGGQATELRAAFDRRARELIAAYRRGSLKMT